jgi:hypothetical protein
MYNFCYAPRYMLMSRYIIKKMYVENQSDK